MRIANARGKRWKPYTANVRGGLEVKRLLDGAPGTPENYLLNVVRSNGSYVSPRHRHNFDQVRLVLDGTVCVAPGRDMTAGQLGYFPEGTWYGPQDDRGRRWTIMIVQFGGASGNGFMSPDEALAAKEKLACEGEFRSGVFRRARGEGRKNQDAYEATWERFAGRRLVYPPPRYEAPVIVEPGAFDWKPAGAAGVRQRRFGSFTERETRLAAVRIDADAGWTGPSRRAVQLHFVLRGEGACDGTAYRTHAAVETRPGERARFEARTETEILVLTMPMIGRRHAALDPAGKGFDISRHGLQRAGNRAAREPAHEEPAGARRAGP
jgi:hypothetical protein